MFRRFLTLAPLAPALAVIAFAAAKAAAQNGAPAANVIEDVQVGESGRLLRVALVCKKDCGVVPRAGGAFFLPGVRESLSVDLSTRTALARALELTPTEGGSALVVRADAALVRASVKPCRIDGGPASCIDLEYAGEGARIAAAAPGEKAEPARSERAQQARTRQEKTAAPVPDKTAPAPQPDLRDSPRQDLLTFTRFAPPERLSPPSSANRPAVPAAPRADPAARRPIIDEERARDLIAAEIDIAAQAREILGREFGIGSCEGARARLRADAWALESMVELGFCEAIAGDLEEADRLFARLLAYTPDNYEALVGRALIAAKAGERGVARKYFQDALNALPPIAESDRIVAAMTRL